MNESTKLLTLINGYKISNAFFLAVEHGLFDFIDGKTDLYEIADLTETDARALEIMLRLFATLDLIEEKQPYRYSLKEEYKKFLKSDSINSYVPLIKLENYLSEFHTSKKAMEHSLVTGTGEDLFNENSKENKVGIYGQAMDNGGRFSSMCIAREFLGLKGGRILDVGGGVGTNVIQLCKMNKTVDVVILEKKEMEDACVSNIHKNNLNNRIQFREADLRTVTIEGQYKGIIVSNILHLFNETTNKQLLMKLASCLEKDGIIVFHDFFVGGGFSQKFIASIYSLDWLMHGSYFCLRPDELKLLVESYGLKVVKNRYYENIPTSIIVAKKP